MLFICNVKNQFRKECEKKYKDEKKKLAKVKKLELAALENEAEEKEELEPIQEEKNDMLKDI